MPTYNYVCKECEEKLEIRQRMSDDPLTLCPACNKNELKKVMVATAGFKLKGSGWFNSGGY